MTDDERMLAMQQVLEMHKPPTPKQEFSNEMSQLAEAKKAVDALRSQGVSEDRLKPYIIKMNEQEFKLRNMMPHVENMQPKQTLEWM